jgi:hypothetical protein
MSSRRSANALRSARARTAESAISLPEVVTTVEEKIQKGRAVCQECFQRSDSFYRQLPIIT